MEFNAKVIKVYDGDTITLAFKYNGEFQRFNCRLIGIDTPELKSHSAQEKELAQQARTFLVDCIHDRIVQIEAGKWDKYGRLLIRVYINNVCINDMMVHKGLAKVYDGGAKSAFIDRDTDQE